MRGKIAKLGASIALTVLALALPALAADELNLSGGMTGAGAPLAMHGYDSVAYFTDGVAMPGSAKHSTVHEGGAYRFVSEANRKLFAAAPEKYAPQYGGFYAYGAAVNKKFDGDPRVFEIVDGKLYFNLNPEIKATWSKDIDGNIRKGDRNWSKIRSRPVSAL